MFDLLRTHNRVRAFHADDQTPRRGFGRFCPIDPMRFELRARRENSDMPEALEQTIIGKLAFGVRVADRLRGVIEVRAIGAASSGAGTAARKKARHAHANLSSAEFWKADGVARATRFVGEARFISPDLRDRFQQIAIKVHCAPGKILVDVYHRSHLHDYAGWGVWIKDF